ncbi:MAG: DUF6077 domain-containing protein [Turicibacter sp.]|nr:DUF6077 domain-containing protein [Turicibacter sp.]
MSYIIVGFVILWLLFIFNVIGKIITLRFNLSFRFNIPLGYVFSLVICQLIGLPSVMLHISSNLFTLLYLVTMAIILCVWVFRIRKKQQFAHQLLVLDNQYELKSKKHWMSVGFLVLGAIFIYINVMQYYTIDRMSDSAFYIPHILENVKTDHIYTLNPWSGVEEPFNSLYLYVTYELFHSMIINVFPVHALLYINHGMTVISFVMIMICICELAGRLFTQKKAFVAVVFWLFITFIFITNIRDNYFFFFSSDIIERLPYTGKVLAYFALVPMLFTCLMDFFKVEQNKKNITGVLVFLNLAMMSLTSTAFFMVGIEYAGILFFLLWSKKNRFDEVLLLLLSTWPLVVFVILAKFPILISGVLLFYVILFWIYKKKIIRIYPLMKYALTIGSLLIPVASLILQLVGGRLGLTVFNIRDFFSRLQSSLDMNTIIIWIISLIGMSLYLKNKEKDETKQLLFAKVPLYIFIVFINPISCAFVATFMTSTSVYHRLFYILPFFPLVGMFIVNLVDKWQEFQPKQAIYTIIVSGFSALLIYQAYSGTNSIVMNRFLNRGYSYKNMITYSYYDTSKMINEFVPENAKVAMYFKDNVWADELRSFRSLSPHVILPYNTYTHRRLTENGEYTKEDYYNYQVMMLLNASMSVNDLFIDENGVLTDMTNGEALLDYVLESYDYIVFPRYYENKEFLRLIFKQGKKIIAKTDREYLIEL